MSAPRILAVGTANPPRRFSQEEVFRLAGYTSPRILNIFLNSDIDYRHFYIDPSTFTPNETADELNARVLRIERSGKVAIIAGRVVNQANDA